MFLELRWFLCQIIAPDRRDACAPVFKPPCRFILARIYTAGRIKGNSCPNLSPTGAGTNPPKPPPGSSPWCLERHRKTPGWASAPTWAHTILPKYGKCWRKRRGLINPDVRGWDLASHIKSNVCQDVEKALASPETMPPSLVVYAQKAIVEELMKSRRKCRRQRRPAIPPLRPGPSHRPGGPTPPRPRAGRRAPSDEGTMKIPAILFERTVSLA